MITDHDLADRLGLTDFERAVLTDEAMGEMEAFNDLSEEERIELAHALQLDMDKTPEDMKEKVAKLEANFNSRGSN